MIKTLKRIMAAEFSRDRSRLVTRGQIRTTERGFVYGGSAPYGMRRVLVSEAGAYLADLEAGDRKTLANTRVRFAPGSPDEIAVVSRIFYWFARDGLTRREIVARLNQAGSSK